MQRMQQAVFKLIDRHQNLEALLKEAIDENVFLSKTSEAPVSGGDNCPSTSVVPTNKQDLSIDACLAYIQARAHLTGTPVPVIAASECAEEICRMLQMPQDVHGEGKNLHYVVSLVKTLSAQKLLNKNLFIENLSSKTASPPLELLWQLHSCSAIPLDRYVMCNLRHLTVLRNLAKNMADLYSKADNEDGKCVMKRDFLEVLVRCGFSEDSLDPRLVETSQEILDWIVIELYKCQSKLKDEPCNHLVANLFELVKCHPVLHQDAIKRFFKMQLCNLLHWNPNEDAMTAIAKQHSHWTYAKSPGAVIAMFNHLLLSLEELQICAVLENVIEGQKVNWQHTLVLVSVFCVCVRKGPASIKGLVSCMLKESLEGSCLFLLHAAFLLARQAAAEGSPDFPSYAQWFQDQFGCPSAVQATSTKTFAFFVKFLNSLVPHEPVHCLKAHVQHPPHPPPKGRDILMDYIVLAKTRLADFKESWHTDDFPPPSTENKTQSKKQNMLAVDDVEVAIATFEKTGRIHERVLQASIFRRPYYMGQFLPTLLTPRLLPDIPDSKMKFIDALKSVDKIPLLMYDKFTKACAAELQMLLEGVSSEDMDDMTMDPMCRLRECVESLPTLMIKESSHQTSQYANIAEHVAVLSGRLTAVLEQLDAKPTGVHNIEGVRHIVLDIYGATSIEPSIMQVIDMLLTCFCKAHTLLVRAKCPLANVAENFASLFATQGALHHPLYHRLFTIICHQGDVLSEDHIAALAALLVHINALGKRMPSVKLQTCCRHRSLHEHRQSEPDQMSILNLICKEIDHCTGDGMKFVLRFCEACLSACELTRSRQSQCIPSELKKKHAYLQSRLHPVSYPEFILTPRQLNTLSGDLLSVSRANQYDQPACSKGKEVSFLVGTEFSFAEWLYIELRIHLCQDALTQMQRKRYHHWALYTRFLPRLSQSTSNQEDPIAVYKNASTVILDALLDCLREPAAPMENCPHEASCVQGAERSRECSASCQEMIQLLQELLTVWSTCVPQMNPSTGPDSPWLLKEFTDRLQRLSEAESGDEDQSLQLEAGLEVANQVMLAQSLPPHLLLTNCLQSFPTPEDLGQLTNYINTHLREHLQADFCTLSFDAVTLILKGIVQLCGHSLQTCPDGSNMVTMVTTLLQESPLITVSILTHWDMLRPLTMQLRESSLQQSGSPTILDCLHELVTEVCCTTSGNTAASTHRLQEIAGQPWTLMVIIICTMTEQYAKQDVPISIFQERLVSRLEQMFKKDEIRCHLFDCLIAKIAWLMLTRPVQLERIDALCSVVSTELGKQPDCIMAAAGDSVLKKFYLQRPIANLYPVVCFRIVQRSQCRIVLQQATKNSGLLMALLQLYTSLEHHHCIVEQPVIRHHECLATDDRQQITNLEFIQSCQSLLQSIISRSSGQTLSSIDPTVYANCSLEMRNMIAHKLEPRPYLH